MDRDGGEDNKKCGVAWHLKTELNAFLQRDGDEPSRRANSNPVREAVVSALLQAAPDLATE